MFEQSSSTAEEVLVEKAEPFLLDKYTERRKIAEGVYGEIFRLKRNDVTDSDTQTIILKKFKKPVDSEGLLNKYQALRSSGVDTWSFYEFLPTENAVLMPDGETEDSFLVSWNNESESANELSSLHLHTLKHFESTLKQSSENAVRAAKNGIYLPNEAWLAHFSVSDSEAVSEAVISRVFPGDFDIVELDKTPKKTVLARKNLEQLRQFFIGVLTAYVYSDTQEERYKRLMRDHVDSEKQGV